MTHPFLAQLQIAAEAVWPSGNALMAVSGGVDSMALLRGMLALSGGHSDRLAVAHFNHQLQGQHSDEVAGWIATTCDRLKIACHIGAADVRKMAADSGTGIEEAARDARYAFLQHTARKHQCSQILVAHTRDDQVETILHHLLRGTGMAGLRGMPQRRNLVLPGEHSSGIMLYRPLLDISRAQALDYLQSIAQDFWDDPTNTDVAFTRNRIRHELLPLLEAEFNPLVRDALSNLGRQAAQLQDALEQIAEQQLNDALVDIDAQIARLRWHPLDKQPRHIIRECFALLWKRQNWPRQRMSFAHYDRLAALVIDGGSANLPGGITAHRRGGLVVIRRPDGP